MFRTVEVFEREVKKIENRRDPEKKKHLLEVELIQARNIEAQQVKQNKNVLRNKFHFENLGIN